MWLVNTTDYKIQSHTVAQVRLAGQQLWRNAAVTVENWQSSDTAFEWNDATSELWIGSISQVVQKH